MDDFINHWGAFTRRLPSRYQVQTIGYLPRKADWIRHTFASCNFSFVGQGGGDFWRAGRRWPIEAPCVLTQWPGEPLEYGPGNGHAGWEELFIVYPAAAMEEFRACGFVAPDRPTWTIARPGPWREALREVLAIARVPREGEADRLDRACERLILESLLPGPAGGGDARRIDPLQDQIARAPHQPFDFAAAARRMGMSPQTFRRHWMRQVGVPPGRYLQEARMKEACRRLVESDLTVGQIAARVGYDDALYFSRKFRRSFKVSPTRYRILNQTSF